MPDGDESERLRAMLEKAQRAKSQSKRKVQRVKPDKWHTHPVAWATGRCKDYFDLVPDEAKNEVTIATAIVRDRAGRRKPVVASNEAGFMDGPVRREAKRSRDTIAELADPEAHMDAEERILTWAKETGHVVEVIGASRPACNRCVRLISEAGARLVTPKSTQVRGPASRGTIGINLPPGYSPPGQSGPSHGPKGP